MLISYKYPDWSDLAHTCDGWSCRRADGLNETSPWGWNVLSVTRHPHSASTSWFLISSALMNSSLTPLRKCLFAFSCPPWGQRLGSTRELCPVGMRERLCQATIFLSEHFFLDEKLWFPLKNVRSHSCFRARGVIFCWQRPQPHVHSLRHVSCPTACLPPSGVVVTSILKCSAGFTFVLI